MSWPSWAAFYAAIGGRYFLLGLQLALVLFAAWITYGRCEDTGKVASERRSRLAELSDMPAPSAEADAWSDWELAL